MLATLQDLLAVPWIRASVIAVAFILGAFVVRLVIRKLIVGLTSRTETVIDDLIVEHTRRPLLITFIIIGLVWAVSVLATKSADNSWHLSAAAARMTYRLLKTACVLVWLLAAIRMGRVVLRTLAGRHEQTGSGLVRTRTLPVFDILVKVTLVGTAIYLWLVTWKVNVSGWLASAGILGIVIGLAAKDTVANLFAGIFILADAPYKIGDFIQLDVDGLRGKVTDIGIRSTRILTRDDIQITIPNAIMGAAKIINETGGPYDKVRVAAVVEAAYGSDVDKVTEVLRGCWQGTPDVCTEPEPQVRFRKFGGSGLIFHLLVWTTVPDLRGPVLSELNMRIYKAFAEAGIEIPYAKRDVYIKEMPGMPGLDGGPTDADSSKPAEDASASSV